MGRAFEEKTVAGLTVTDWPAATRTRKPPTLLCLPGVSSTGRVWSYLADELPGHRIIAPDLRGRGGSATLTGPTGLRAHAKDVAAIAAELDLQDVVVVGHSMGAFLAPQAAEELGERAQRLVLIDGGPRPALPFFMKPPVVRFLFRQQIKKGAKEYPTVEAFVDRFGKKFIANRPDLRPVLIEILAHDLTKTANGYRPVIDAERVAADAVDSFCNPATQQALLAVKLPTHLIAATGGTSDKAKAFLADGIITPVAAAVPSFTWERVTSNHLTLLFAPEVMKAVAG